MIKNALNDRAISNLKPEAKEKKYFDGGGLYLAVKPNGKKGRFSIFAGHKMMKNIKISAILAVF